MKVTIHLEGKNTKELATGLKAHLAMFEPTGATKTTKTTKSKAKDEDDEDEDEADMSDEDSDDTDADESDESETDDADETDEDEEEAPKKSAKSTKAKKITTEELNDACKDRLKRIMKKRKLTSGKALLLVKSLLNKHFETESVSKIAPEDRARALTLLSAELK